MLSEYIIRLTVEATVALVHAPCRRVVADDCKGKGLAELNDAAMRHWCHRINPEQHCTNYGCNYSSVPHSAEFCATVPQRVCTCRECKRLYSETL